VITPFIQIKNKRERGVIKESIKERFKKNIKNLSNPQLLSPPIF
jgi:hypothetical protein